MLCGINEVECFVDLVGLVVCQGELICVCVFQLLVGCINVECGSVVWNCIVGGINGVGVDDQVVVVGDVFDWLLVWKLVNGDLVWLVDQFQNCKLFVLVVLNKQVLIGDFEGQIYLFDCDIGKMCLCLLIDGFLVVVIVLLGDIVLVVIKSGGLFVIKVE